MHMLLWELFAEQEKQRGQGVYAEVRVGLCCYLLLASWLLCWGSKGAKECVKRYGEV